MASQNGGKGNPASHRMSNPKLKERRAKSWARGERRKVERNKRNEERMKRNQAELAELGGQRRLYERVVIRDGKTITRMKMESPGTALARVKREGRA